jgi:hypothetical protein
MRPAQQVDLRCPRVDDRRQLLVVNLDELGGVLGQGARVGNHSDHRLADVAHVIRGQHRVGLVGELGALQRQHGKRPDAVAEIGRREHA